MSKSYEERLDDLRERISSDTGLKSVGTKITYTSLVCLAITLSGATIKQANTFLFEIEFSSPKGLSALLALALIFLLIRYHNFAADYLEDIRQIGNSRFEKNPLIVDSSHPSGFMNGVIGEIAEDIQGAFKARFKWKFPLHMTVEIDAHEDTQMEASSMHYDDIVTHRISLNDGKYAKSKKEKASIILCLIKTKILNYTNHPDHLNLLAPYYLGCFALIFTIINFLCPSFIPSMFESTY